MMKWQSTLLVVLSVATLAACSSLGRPPSPTGCPAGHSNFEAGEVALRLGEDDRQRTYRLPIGEVVVVPEPEICESGAALEPLAHQSPSSTPGPRGITAYRAVRVGVAYLNGPPCMTEACFVGFGVTIKVTDGCQLLSRTDAISKVLTRHPISIPQGEPVPPPPATKVKLIKASQYEQIFGEPLYLPADTKVWAVLTGTPIVQSPSPSGPSSVLWLVTAVDACTDWMSRPWEATSTPPGWTAVPDLSTTVM
jgi:hypothetical protein